MRTTRRDNGPGAYASGLPAFSITWLACMSAVYLALVYSTGTVSSRVLDAVGFIPARVVHEPWRLLAAPVAMIVTGDNVQFAYLVATFALVVLAFESRFGTRRTLRVFFVAGIGSVVAVTVCVFAPLALFAGDTALVQHALSRPYVGASPGIFAVAGAFATTLATRHRRIAIVSALIAWETFVWAWVFAFTELLPLVHYVSVALGWSLMKRDARSRAPTSGPNP